MNKEQRSKQRTKGDQGTKVKEPVASVVGERGTSPSRYPAHSNRLPWGRSDRYIKGIFLNRLYLGETFQKTALHFNEFPSTELVQVNP